MSAFFGNVKQPGTVSKVDSAGLTTQGAISYGALGIVGLAGAGDEDHVYRFTGVSQARDVFQNGAMLDCLRAFFAMGGTLVYAVRVGAPVAATKQFAGPSSNPDSLTLTALDKGTGGNNIQAKIEVGSGGAGFRTLTIRQNDGNVNILETFSAAGVGYSTKTALLAAVNATDGTGSEIVVATADVTVDVPDAVAYTNLAGGTNGSRSNQEITDGLALLIAQPVDISILDDPTTAYHAILEAHCEEASNIQNRSERTGVMGMANGTSVSSYITEAGTLDKRSVLVAPCVYTPDFGVNLSTTSLKSGHIGAALVAGLKAGQLDPAMPITMQAIRYATALEHEYNNSEIDQLIDAGVLVLAKRPQGNVVVKQLTCANDSGFQEWSVVTLIDFVMKDLRAYYDANFIGRKGTKAALALIESGTRGKLFEYVQNEILFTFLEGSVKADFLAGDQTWINVSFSAVPVMPINNIGLTGSFSTIYNWNVSVAEA